MIFGVQKAYGDVVEEGFIERLSERREQMFVKFAIKCSKNSRIKDKWFPQLADSGHNTRNRLTYVELPARTESLMKSPLYQMRKRLNYLNRND